MAHEWDLVRVGKGSHGVKGKSEVRIMHYQALKNGRNPRIGIRVSEACMKIQRWFPGDMVRARIVLSEDGKSLQAFVMRTDDGAVGVKLTQQGKKSGPSTVQFTVPKEMAAAIFSGDKTGFDGRMEHASGDAKTAVFVFDLV